MFNEEVGKIQYWDHNAVVSEAALQDGREEDDCEEGEGDSEGESKGGSESEGLLESQGESK